MCLNSFSCFIRQMASSLFLTLAQPIVATLHAAPPTLHVAPPTQPRASLPPLRPRAAVLLAEPAADECGLDEPQLECAVRRQVDGPWADAWARYVLLRPGMSYRELKEATRRRNRLRPEDRIPGTFRTVVLVHAVCFTAAIPALLRNDAVFPKLLEAAASGVVRAGI